LGGIGKEEALDENDCSEAYGKEYKDQGDDAPGKFHVRQLIDDWSRSAPENPSDKNQEPNHEDYAPGCKAGQQTSEYAWLTFIAGVCHSVFLLLLRSYNGEPVDRASSSE
jgi:hypothetical protein